jgi:imidazolonepropionase
MKRLKNIRQLATLDSVAIKDGRKLNPEDLSILENASVVFDDQSIIWVGADDDLPSEYSDSLSYDCSKYIVTPELVDCHTHLIFGGNRANEYSMRLNGADYQKIAEAGGGILATMNGTNQTSEEDLFQLACNRIERLASLGIGTIEIKSGYGLNFEKEKELTKIIDRLKKHWAPNVQIFNTFMAAHAIPKDFSSGEEYLQKVVLPLLVELAPLKIIDAVDIFHETGYFNESDVRLLFNKAKELGLEVKSHADEFVNNNGAALATEFNALSTDHLLRTSEAGIKTLAGSSTTAVLLPGTGFFLGKPQANARTFLDAGVRVAIGSDYNPGSCHCDNVLLIASISAPTYKMNMAELWSSITFNAARALGLRKQGAIAKGMTPRFSFFEASELSEITYNWGKNLARQPFILN